MKAGVVYPQVELGGDTGAVKAFAQAAEELGYDHIVIYDHVLGTVHAGREPKLTGPYKETDPFHEPLVTYAYLAGITKKLELATGVIVLPQRQTALFAKQAADVDLFSEGRLRLGVGVGWNWVEFDGLEMSRHFRRRGRRQEQQIALIRKLWEQPVVEHEDSDHRIVQSGVALVMRGLLQTMYAYCEGPPSTPQIEVELGKQLIDAGRVLQRRYG